MPQEKKDYRPILEALNGAFPDKYLLTVTDVAGFLGVCRATVRRRYPLPRGEHTYTKAEIARRVAR
jgi:hypothetical protein